MNIRVPDRMAATAFYISGLGLTRAPYLMTGTDNMWANVGISQFHLPSGPAQVLRGTTALVLPDREALLWRLAKQRKALAGTHFDFRETEDAVETTCPWGNHIRVHAPDAARFGRITLGMPYVEFDVPPGTTPGIARFYREILQAPAQAADGVARVLVAHGQYLAFRVEHEVRSMTHPRYARPLVNRNAGINNRNYMPGHEAWPFAMPPEAE